MFAIDNRTKPAKLSKSNKVNINTSKRSYMNDNVGTQSIRQDNAKNSTTILGRGKRDKRPQTWMKDYIN